MSLRPTDATSPTAATDSEKFGRLRDLAFFKDFGEVELWEVVRVATWHTIEAGTVLMRENEQTDSLYVLVDGEVEVSLLGKPISLLKPGVCFGEILYFADAVERRTTTVTAARASPSARSRPARCASPRLRARSASTRPSCACWSNASPKPIASLHSAERAK